MNQAIKDYLAKLSADSVAIVAEIEVGTVRAVIIPTAQAVEILGACTVMDEKSPASGGGLHLRGRILAFRRALQKAFPDMYHDQRLRWHDFGLTEQFISDFKAWQAGRDPHAYNIGNYCELRVAQAEGIEDHPDRNAKPGVDIVNAHGERIEVKALMKASFQIELA